MALLVRACVGASLAQACSLERSISIGIPELPEEITLGGILISTEQGLQFSSPLSTLEDGRLLILSNQEIEDLAMVEFIGYATARLMSSSASVDVPGVLRDRLSIADPGEAALPLPSFYARGTALTGRAELAESSPENRRFTAQWVSECGLAGGQNEVLLIDLSCAGLHCSTFQATRRGCSLEFSSRTCEQGGIQGSIARTGEVRLGDGENLFDCVAQPPAPGALASHRCKARNAATCRVDLYQPPLAARFSSTQVKVLDVPARPVLLGRGAAQLGYLGDLVPLGDRLVVTGLGGEFLPTRFCQGAPSSTIHIFDSESLELVRTVTAAPCLIDLEPDPAGDGFLGLFSDQPHSIARFDRQGDLIASGRLEPDRIDPSLLGVRMSIDLRDRRILVLYALPDPALSGALAAFDFERLQPLFAFDGRTDVEVTSDLHDLVLLNGGQVGALDSRADALHLFTPSLALIRSIPLDLSCGAGVDSIFRGQYLPDLNRILFATRDDREALHSLDLGTELCISADVFENAGEPYALALFPERPALALAGVVRGDLEQTAELVVVDTEVPRVLAGTSTLGAGAITEIQFDAAGRIWILLPFSAAIGRVNVLRPP